MIDLNEISKTIAKAGVSQETQESICFRGEN